MTENETQNINIESIKKCEHINTQDRLKFNEDKRSLIKYIYTFCLDCNETINSYENMLPKLM